MNDTDVKSAEADKVAEPFHGHTSDGIRCQDGGIPGWWRAAFVASIVVSPFYMLYLHGGASGRGTMDAFDRAIAANMQQQMEQLGELELTGDSVGRFMDEPAWLQVGKGIFRGKCASCHGGDGGGIVGPNLTDDHYKNIRDLDDFIAILQSGAAGGAMPSWSGKLSDNDMVLVSAYVASLKGTYAPGGKAAEGEIVERW